VIDALVTGPSGSAALFGTAFVIVVLMRAPFLGPGYGTDPDAWSVAYAARQIAETGRYFASRFPGSPVQEFLCSFLWRGGPRLLCGASAVMSAIAAGFFALLFRRAGGRPALLAALALASVPTIHIVGVQALDNDWGLAFILASWYAALNGRATLAGVLLGLAIGTRISTVVWFAAPAATLAVSSDAAHRLRRLAMFTAASALVAAIAFAPLYIQLGLGFLQVYGDRHVPLVWFLKLPSVDLWGIPGTLALCVAVPMALWPKRADAVPAVLDRKLPTAELLGWLAGIAGVLAVYVWAPLEAAYNIPAVPLTIMLLAHRLARPAFTALCVALLVSPWLLKVREAHAGRESAFGEIGPFMVGGQAWVLEARGPALENQYRRRQMIRERDEILARARALTGENVLIVDGWMSVIRTTLNGRRLGSSTFYYRSGEPGVSRLRARGARVVDPFP